METLYMDNTFPFTYEQKIENQKAFIEAIDPDAVCRLASLHNGGKPCRIFKETAHGSFNACFFVEFTDDEPTTTTANVPSTAATDTEAAADAGATTNSTSTATADVDITAAGATTDSTDSTPSLTTTNGSAALATSDAGLIATVNATAATDTTTNTTDTTTDTTATVTDTTVTDATVTDATVTDGTATGGTATGATCSAGSLGTTGTAGDADTAKPTTKWVVRIPTLPTVHEPWEKIRGEVATIRYLEANTKIKVPHVHAFGPAVVDEVEETDKTKDDKAKEDDEAKERDAQAAKTTVKTDDSNPTGHAYMIIDYIVGEKLDLVALFKSEREKRDYFFSQLIDILAELVDQEFDKCGSLTLNDAGEPVLGPLQSMHLDGLRMDLGNKGWTWTPTEGWKKRRRAPKSTMFSSAVDYALFQYRLIRETHLLPATGMTMKDAQFEEMILHDAKGLIFGAIDYEGNHGPFVLNHTDLRWSNIIVNDNFDIQGVVDWEWSAVMPRQFFMPPFWISGEEAKQVGRSLYGVALIFLTSLLEKKKKNNPSPGCLKLNKIWATLSGQSEQFVVPYLLRHHHEFLSMYKFSVLHEKRKLSPDEFIKHHLALTGEDGPLAKEAKRKLEYAQKYEQYLRDNGLYVEDKNGQDALKKEGKEEATAGAADAPIADRDRMLETADSTKKQDEHATSGLENVTLKDGVCEKQGAGEEKLSAEQ